MRKSEMRKVAILAARSQARKQGFDPENLSDKEALAILDDLFRMDHVLIAVTWYAEASEYQFDLFRREWNSQKGAK